ncbi:MAG: TFIIB-type zinc finger domain-containing protein [Bacteroides sp.]|nr:TFIIB-type zinc finger domain-containing protein [Bacteroides sp.]
MKPLTCEMCGSTNLLKQDGVFVCQSCGTKYSVEEAKKMMVEGTVSVEGTVKIDTSSELQNLYQIARRAKDSNNSENAQKYYDMILIKDPNSWEASFYVGYYSAMQCKIGEISLAAQKVSDSYPATLALIQGNLPHNEQEEAIAEITNKVVELGNMLFNAAYSSYRDIDGSVRSQFSPEYMNHAFCAANLMLSWGNQLYDIDKTKYKDTIVALWSNGVDCMGLALKGALDADSMAGLKALADTYENKLSELSPDYQKKNYSSGPCYVATAVYGSYDCPEVWTLRRFRDYTLAETWYGRAFIHTYYAISPTIVKWFGSSHWFKVLWHKPLDKLVKRLKAQGVESTPYQDKEF